MRKPGRISTAFLAVAVPIVVIASPQSPPSIKFEPYVEIDGAKNPELLPEHVVWREGFRVIRAGVAERGAGAIIASLHLQDSDMSLVVKEAKRQGELEEEKKGRSAECKAAILPPGVPLERTPPALLQQASTAIREIVMHYREQVLSGRDALLAALSEEGAHQLTRWMDERRRGLKLSVPKSDMDSGWYRLPQ